MKGSLDEALKRQLKNIIATESDRDIEPETISDDEPLFGEESPLQLDSLDLLQISMAVYKAYGTKITDANQARRAFATVNTLADEVKPE